MRFLGLFVFSSLRFTGGRGDFVLRDAKDSTRLSRRLVDPSEKSMDPGEKFGSLYVHNFCPYPVFAESEGAWHQNSTRNKIEITIPAGSVYHEGFRETIPKPTGKNATYDHISGKLEGQGVAFKITVPPKDYGGNILQLEYALIQNPENKDTFKRLNYDISLLNCAVNTTVVTDAQASQEPKWNRKKIDGCPGYQNGLAMWTSDYKSCPPVYCDGIQFCDGIYHYDKTRPGEASWQCKKEYHGNLNLELCAGNGNGTGYDIYEKWRTEGLNASAIKIPEKPASQTSIEAGPSPPYANITTFHTSSGMPSYGVTPTDPIVTSDPYSSEVPSPTCSLCPVGPICSNIQSDISCTFNSALSTSECWSRLRSSTPEAPLAEAVEPTPIEPLSTDVVPTELASSEPLSTDVVSTELSPSEPSTPESPTNVPSTIVDSVSNGMHGFSYSTRHASTGTVEESTTEVDTTITIWTAKYVTIVTSTATGDAEVATMDVSSSTSKRTV